ESGSACVSSRGNYGAISLRDWSPVGVDEYGYVAPDPVDPDIVYGGRNVSRYDRRTGQTSSVGPIGGRGGAGGPQGTFRQVRTMPVVFSEVDTRALFFANNHVWKTISGGTSWTQISPDLTRPSWETPKSVGKYSALPQAKSARRGVIYTVAPSYQDANRIWAGTDDGLIHVTANNGAAWKDVTPSALRAWAKVSLIDAGRFDPLTAYAAINTLRLDDLRPHIMRTHDGGATWTEIVNGIPDGETVNAVREDPKKKGLLFAATERTVYVSFDDGANWRSLRVNLPATSVRDIIVKDDDLVIATHGRGFWILDDITALRGIRPDPSGAIQPLTADGAGEAVIIPPAAAWRVRWNTSSDMPWPAEEPTGQNPPDGAIINYFVRSPTAGALTLEVVRADGRIVRRYSSADAVAAPPDPASAPVPTYWYRRPQTLSTTPGLHRFIWDLHYQPLPELPGGGAGGGRGGGGGLPITAIPGNSAPAPTTPWVTPGTYTLKLTANGKTHEAPIVVKQDPRVKTPAIAMGEVYRLTDALYFGALDAQAAAVALGALRQKASALRDGANGIAAQALDDFVTRASALEGSAGPAGGGVGARGAGAPAGPPPATDTLWAVRASLSGLMNSMQAADVAPTMNTRGAIAAARGNAAKVMARYRALQLQVPPVLR
ncbi:MAG: glycoside hydrolase, partial [Vicinamibacterales bacterium]